MKTKSIQHLEEQMESLPPDSLRYKILAVAKNFKSSWIELGQHLFTVYRDKHFKDWGYLTFEAYCSKEIGVRQATAFKLLKSYSFLEREEPKFLREKLAAEKIPSRIPSVESVNALRLAKQNERFPESEYETLRQDVLGDVKPEEDVRKKIRYVLKVNPKELSAAEEEERKAQRINKFILNLRTAKDDFEQVSIPGKVLKQIDILISLLEDL